MIRLEEQVLETTTRTINPIVKLSIQTDHNDKTNPFSTCHILQPSKINLDGSYQVGFIQLSPGKKIKKMCDRI